MRADPWEKHERDVVHAENNASQAWERGNVLAYEFWCKQANIARKEARKVRRVHDRAFARDEGKER